MSRRRAGIVALWLCSVALAAIIVAHARYINDLSAFLPAKPTPLQQVLVDQLREGPAARLILMAIGKGDADTRARVSAAMAARLRLSPAFLSVTNGEDVTAERDREFLFQRRYLLSEAVNAQRFSAAGLRDAIQAAIDDLATPSGLMLKALMPRDPTGELMQIIGQLTRSAAPASRDGVWISPDGERALLVVQTAAAGSDTDAQERAIDAIRAAFAASLSESPTPHGAVELKLTGPGVFAVAARANIKRAAVRLSIAGSALVVALLLAVYRSPPALALGLLPVASGALIGVAAVALVFGAIHGITLGFGITLIGESVDYSIYFFIQSHRRPDGGGAGSNWRRRWWPTVRLGMLTSVCGFASLLPSGFPGLAQLGLYSISGLITAAMVTRYVLPALLPQNFAIHDPTPIGVGAARLLRPIRRLRGIAIAGLAAALAAAALAVLLSHRTTLWNRELAALSPVSAADQAFDAKLRADLGAADTTDLIILSGDTLEWVLMSAERAGRALEPLVNAHQIGGFDSPVKYLPSLATQEARRGSLPDAAQLRDNLQRATSTLAVRSERLLPFLSDAEAARHAALISAQDLQATSMGAGFDALVMHQGNRWNALLPLHAASPGQEIDTAKVNAALGAAHLDEVRLLNMKHESDALYESYLAQAIHFSLAGFLGLVVLLLLALRSPQRVARVLAPLVLAVLTVAACLAISGTKLTILHLVGMLLIVAVGSNYALFFDRLAAIRDGGSDPSILASLVIADASTVMGFGLLSFSGVPVLVALGATVAPGAFLALLFAAVLSRGEPSHA